MTATGYLLQIILRHIAKEIHSVRATRQLGMHLDLDCPLAMPLGNGAGPGGACGPEAVRPSAEGCSHGGCAAQAAGFTAACSSESGAHGCAEQQTCFAALVI